MLLTLFGCLALFNLRCDALFDIAPPEIEIIEPLVDVTYFNALPVKIQVTDNRKVEKVEVIFDDELKHVFTKEPFAKIFEFAEMGGIPQILKIVAYDPVGNWSDSERRISIIEESISEPDIPSGPSSGNIDSSYTYSAGGSSSNVGHSLQYRFEWGDGSYSSVLSSADASQTWNTIGTYQIKAQAICTTDTGVVSAWSSSRSVTITRSTPMVGSFNTPGVAWGVFVSGNYAYIADWNKGLSIIDISDPASPMEAGNYFVPSYTRGVFVSGHYAYVAANTGGLVIIDISNPLSPTTAGFYDTPGYALDVYVVADSLAYVADGISGVQIIDVSNPANPTLAGYYDTPVSASKIFVSGNLVYVADKGGGLQIIDISDPASPKYAGYYDTPRGAQDVKVQGSYAYVTDLEAGLLIIDITNPANLILEGSYDTNHLAHDLAVSGNYAFVADGINGLLIINVSNPSDPTLVGFYDTPGYALDVFVTDNYAFVADESTGLLIIDISGLP